MTDEPGDPRNREIRFDVEPSDREERNEIRILRLEQQLQRLHEQLHGARGRLDLSMRGQLRCPCCGCRRIFRSNRVLDRSDSGRKPLSLVQPSVWSSRGVGELEAYVCSDCGLVEWYVADLEQLAEHSQHFEVLEGPGDDGPYR